MGEIEVPGIANGDGAFHTSPIVIMGRGTKFFRGELFGIDDIMAEGAFHEKTIKVLSFCEQLSGVTFLIT
jgi:hypothetical protein